MPLLPTEMKQTGTSAFGAGMQQDGVRGGGDKVASNLDKWVAFLSQAEIPVLRTTVDELARLEKNEDDITARDISKVVLRDPLLTLKVLRFMQEHRKTGATVEITTVEHAIMMLGIIPFFRQFHEMQVVEEILVERPDALENFMTAIDQTHRAAMYAWEWALLRHDIESDEIIIATLLHDIAEMLLWCLTPEYAARIARKMRQDNSMDSAAAQKSVLGFSLNELQPVLAEQWHLPTLLQSLMDDAHGNTPRIRNVALAVALARHSANGWYNVALPDDYAATEKLVCVSRSEVMTRIYRVSLKAIRALNWHDKFRRPAVWLPPLPLEVKAEDKTGDKIGDGENVETSNAALERVTKLLTIRGTRRPDFLEVLSQAFYGMYAGLGLNRVLFMEINDKHSKATAKFLVGAEEASLLRKLQIDLVHPHVFSRLMGKMEAIWYSADTQNELQSLLLEEMIRIIWDGVGNCEFFIMPILVNGDPIGLIYADGGRDRPVLNSNEYTEFQKLCLLMAESLE